MQLKDVICLGVAGNFAHHLEQAGELEDFKNVATETADAPKGIFPFYLPQSQSFLGLYSIGTDTLNLPNYEANAQVEPEIAVLFDIIYDENKKVTNLNAQKFTTFNDCTIRKEVAKKISEKKSWGINSKGIGDKWIAIDKFEEGGVMDNYHLCTFVKRDGVLHPYGVDAPLLGYILLYQAQNVAHRKNEHPTRLWSTRRHSHAPKRVQLASPSTHQHRSNCLCRFW